MRQVKHPILVTELTYIGCSSDLYKETVPAESCPLFRVLRHRATSSPIYLSEGIHKPFALSREYSSYPAEGKVSFS